MNTKKVNLFIKSICIAFVLTVLYSVIPFQAECKEISNEVLRFHILANSDSNSDQLLKLKVRDKVLEYSENIFDKATSKLEAESLVKEKLNDITKVAQNEVFANGYNYSVKTELVNMYFNTRYYDNFTMPAGKYDAIRITIGNGKGHNWWCVMYPSLCLSASMDSKEKAEKTFTDNQCEIIENSENENIEYKFKIVEVFQNLCSKISK